MSVNNVMIAAAPVHRLGCVVRSTQVESARWTVYDARCKHCFVLLNSDRLVSTLRWLCKPSRMPILLLRWLDRNIHRDICFLLKFGKFKELYQ